MGMNYYLLTGLKKLEKCPCCGEVREVPEKLHVGKSSAGRYYSLQSYPERGLVDLESWKSFIKKALESGGSLIDEEDAPLTEEDLYSVIMREGPGWSRFSEEDHLPGEAANEFGDVFGVKGLIYSSGRRPAEDGPYVVISGEWC